MSVSEEESFGYFDNEQINECEDEEIFAHRNYYCPEEEDNESFESLHPRWRRVPRSPQDFIASKSTVSTCGDSEYERWLEKFYDDVLKEDFPSRNDVQVDTTDLVEEKAEDASHSVSHSSHKSLWWESTKYWGPRAIRRHWPLRKTKGVYLFFPTIYPDLNLRSRYGRFHSLMYTAAAVPENNHKAMICNIFKKVTEGLVVSQPKLLKILNCDNLYNLKWFDYMTKTAVMRCLCKFLRTQYRLEKVFFENADLRRLEAIIILCALSRNGGDQIKELHIWKMFGYGQCPVLLNELPERGKSSREKKSLEYFTKIHYRQILYKFSCLTHLSVNYAYIANEEGDALLCIKSVRTGCLRELRILCLKDERPFLTNPGYGVGGWVIADGVWKRAAELCPEMRVKFVFLNMPQYENIKLFLSKCIPVSYVYISSGSDFSFETPWDIDSTLLELRNWYANTLESLCLHLWHHRDLLDFVIKSKILEEFPNLVHFEFIGVLDEIETLNLFCCKLSQGTYKLKILLFWVQDQHTDRKKLEATRKRVREIREKHQRRFQILDIDADIQTYAL